MTNFDKWKQGIKAITPMQQIKVQILFNAIIILGLVLGVVFSFMATNRLWWLIVVLFGAFGNSVVSMIALIQKKMMISQFSLADLPVQINKEELKGGDNGF